MKILFVINPNSGNKSVTSLEERIAETFSSPEFSWSVHRIGAGDATKAIRHEINTVKPDVVGCAGGDGTVNLLAGILANTKITLAIIPLGSANGMARELQIGDVKHALTVIRDGKTRRIELLKINGKICIHLADVGLNARIVKRFQMDSTRGLFTYARHFFSELFLIRSYRFLILYDGQRAHYQAVSVTLANASKYGTGAVINPTGKLGDGKFELVIVKPFPRHKLLHITWRMFLGTLHTSEYVTVLSCREAHIVSTRKTTLQIDGEVIGKVKEITAEVLPDALTVAVPESSLD